MKRAIFLFGILCIMFVAKGQSSTIKDYGETILIEFDHGDTIPLYKNTIFPWKSTRGVKLYIPENFIPATVRTSLLDLSYSDFGYANDTVFLDYLNHLILRDYHFSYAYDATSGGPDTIWYILGNEAADTAYIWVGTYSGDSLTNGKIIHP